MNASYTYRLMDREQVDKERESREGRRRDYGNGACLTRKRSGGVFYFFLLIEHRETVSAGFVGLMGSHGSDLPRNTERHPLLTLSDMLSLAGGRRRALGGKRRQYDPWIYTSTRAARKNSLHASFFAQKACSITGGGGELRGGDRGEGIL